MRKETAERLKVIRRMYEDGSSVEEIAQAIGYKPHSVYDMMARYGIIPRKLKWADGIDPSKLVFAKKRSRKPVRVCIGGKWYWDVTAMYVES